MSLQEEELVSSHAGQPEQASSLLDQIMAQTRIQPGSEGYDVARQGVTEPPRVSWRVFYL